MNRNKLKSYAPKARRDFIQAITDRAAYYGLTKNEITPIIEKGDTAIIDDRPFPIGVAQKRKKLEERIKVKGFDQVMEAMAYTWFNRFVAIRYMEIHGYLEHGYRVFSSADNTENTVTTNGTNHTNNIPEILKHIEHVDLPGLDREKVIELKLDGSKESELYRMVLIAQCNSLHDAMPFLFEKVDDETELLLPDNLLHSDSLIRRLVNEIPEEDWSEVEIIGWLYQFYISEKKDEVFEGLKKNKKITPENIPAATQLFTPHWIVRYLVENSLGRLWMLNRPHSRLIDKMEYYIKPEEPETDFLKINTPEEIKICDLACGSGHMLVYAFDLLYYIYEEMGYKANEIPQKILENNLYGIEIAERAGELAAFALTMKARERDRRFFQRRNSEGKPIEPNICVLENVRFSEDEIETYMDRVGRDLFTTQFQTTLHQFEEADNFGSLIQPALKDVKGIEKRLQAKGVAEDLFLSKTHKKVIKILKQTEYLNPKYYILFTNPPYMGSNGMNGHLKLFLDKNYFLGKADLMTCFMEQSNELIQDGGFWGMINLPSWMFLQSFSSLRSSFLNKIKIDTLLHLGRGIFGADFGTTAFTIYKPSKELTLSAIKSKGTYKKLFGSNSIVRNPDEISEMFFKNDAVYRISQSGFIRIPGNPIAYWFSDNALSIFDSNKTLDYYYDARQGMATADNERFLRQWHELSMTNIGFGMGSRDEAKKSGKRWFPYNKGGGFRKWYGNQTYVVNWANDGKELLLNRPKSVIRSPDRYFCPSASWSKVTIGNFSLRYFPNGFLFDVAGCSIFTKENISLYTVLGALNSPVMNRLYRALMPTVNYEVGQISKFPFTANITGPDVVSKLIEEGKTDWDSSETSWDFNSLSLLHADSNQVNLKNAYQGLRTQWHKMTFEMKRLEEENNHIFIEAYGLKDEMTPEVPLEEITLTCNPYYRYGKKAVLPSGARDQRPEIRELPVDEDLEARLLSDTIKELVSYAVGCMMGRYSIDVPGLIYANSGNVDFDNIYQEKHRTNKFSESRFLPDEDGIIPVTDIDWFIDDAVNRITEFIGIVWPKENLEENLRFIADALEPKQDGAAIETIRRYMSTGFYKHHLTMYKKRPIYWLFTSGKERAFQCLVYLHRYNEGTLARMRTEYVIPLQGKINARIDQLEGDYDAASSTAFKRKLEKEKQKLVKQRVELQTFDEKLRHFADMRIRIDLDDGVKVNYGKFGDLLAEVKAVTGKTEE